MDEKNRHGKKKSSLLEFNGKPWGKGTERLSEQSDEVLYVDEESR